MSGLQIPDDLIAQTIIIVDRLAVYGIAGGDLVVVILILTSVDIDAVIRAIIRDIICERVVW